MTLPANSAWEIHPSSGSDTNGGGFCLTGNTFATDLAATLANTSAPVATSASYNFVSGDVGHYLYIASGTNWTPGLYPILSVASNAATLGIPDPGTGTFAGCATVASPTSGSWSIDRSRKDTAQVTFDGTTIAAHNAAAGATITFTGYTGTPADVGNVCNISGGTLFTTGRYQIISQTSTTWTLDRNCTTGAGVGMVAKMGGAAAGLNGGAAGTVMTDVKNNGTAGNKFFMKGTLTTSSSPQLSAPGQAAPGNNTMPNRLIGYTTIRGDGGMAFITLATNTGLSLKVITNGWVVENITIDCASLGTSTGIVGSSAKDFIVRNCLVKNFTSNGITLLPTGAALIENCEITGGTSAAANAVTANSGRNIEIVRCNIHDNSCTAIAMGGSYANGVTVLFCLISNNSGASSDGINYLTGGPFSLIINNTIYNNGRHGISGVNGNAWGDLIRNNILAKNGGYGIQLEAAAGWPALQAYDGNAFWSNTSGARNFMDDISTNLVNLVAPYTNTLDVTLTGDPFTNSAGNDFTLNNTAGAGAACRAAGTPGTLLGRTQAGKIDMGCYQHADPGGVGVCVVAGQPALIVTD